MDNSWVTLILIMIRTSCVLVLFPVTAYRAVPNVVKAWISLVVAFAIFSGGSHKLESDVQLENFRFIFAIGSEVFVGLLLGFAVLLVFSAFRMAGQLIDLKMGLSTAGLFDPQYGSTSTIISQLYHLFAMVTYLALNGHHYLFLSLVESFKVVPLGMANWDARLMSAVFQYFVSMWAMAFQIAAPVFATVIITDLSLGLVAKTVPQIQVFLLGMPIKIFLGLLVVYITLPYFAILVEEAFNRLPSILILIMESVS